MGEVTGVSWAHHSLNLWIGCKRVSEGCLNCYAERMQRIWKQAAWGPETAGGTRIRTKHEHWGQLFKWNEKAKLAGERRRVFINSQSDFFEDWSGPMANTDLSMSTLRRMAFEYFDRCDWLDFLLVTKRPQNAVRMIPEKIGGDPIRTKPDYHTSPRRNIWLLTSVENQAAADERIPELLKCRDLVGVLGISAEPLLEPIEVSSHFHPDNTFNFAALDWVIGGGESGEDAKRREMPLQALESLFEQCQQAGVPFFCKQDSARKDGQQGRIPDQIWNTKQFPKVLGS